MCTIITCPTVLLEEAKKNGKHLGVELIEKDGHKSLSFAGGPPFVLHPELPAIDERLKMMADSELAMAALEAHTATLGYRLTGEQGENWCNVYNDGIADLVKRYPDRFVGMASVPLQDPARAAKVLERAVRDLNFRGGYIGTNVNGNYYGTDEFDPFWAKAQELDVMVVMHPEDVAGADKMNPYGLKLICGNPADSALCFGFMTYSGVFDRFPNLKLCILHGGGFFPYHLGRFDQGWEVRAGARAAKAKMAPSSYLEKHLLRQHDLPPRHDQVSDRSRRHRPHHGRHRLSLRSGRLGFGEKSRSARHFRSRQAADARRQRQALAENQVENSLRERL